MKKYLIIILCSATLSALLTILFKSLEFENSSVMAGSIVGAIVGALSGVFFGKNN